MTPEYRALVLSVAALLTSAISSFALAESKPLSEIHRARHHCIDDCRSVATVCTTKCGSEDCLDACTEPLASCIDECRAKYPRKARQ